MWFEGRLSAEIPNADSYEAGDPNLLAALAPHSKKLQARLVEAIEAGTLNTSLLRRGWDETLDPNFTHVTHNDLVEWLKVRGYTVGAAFQEYAFDEAKIHSHAVDEIKFLRALKRSGLDVQDAAGQYRSTLAGSEATELERMRAALRDAVLEKDRIKERLKNIESERIARVDRPLTTRERRTLLTIIGALAREAEIDVRERGTAALICALTDAIGVPITDDTIRRILAEIPDAVEARNKGP